MIIFVYTFAVVFVALVVILGLGAVIADMPDSKRCAEPESDATASMCTTQLLESGEKKGFMYPDDFIIEQDIVCTYDSVNL